MNLPSTWQTPAARRLYESELKRLGRFLVRLGGLEPDAMHLRQILLQWDDARTQLRGLRGTLKPRLVAEARMALHQDGALPAIRSTENTAADHLVPVALLGGPLTSQGLALFDQIEMHGGWVALDGTETGERTLPAPVDRRAVQDRPLDELVRIHFDSIPEIWQRPNSRIYQWLQQEMPAHDIRGILVYRYTWCDLWHAEVGRLKEWARVPVLDLEVDPVSAGSAVDRTATRVQAFMDLLR